MEQFRSNLVLLIIVLICVNLKFSRPEGTVSPSPQEIYEYEYEDDEGETEGSTAIPRGESNDPHVDPPIIPGPSNNRLDDPDGQVTPTNFGHEDPDAQPDFPEPVSNDLTNSNGEFQEGQPGSGPIRTLPSVKSVDGSKERVNEPIELFQPPVDNDFQIRKRGSVNESGGDPWNTTVGLGHGVGGIIGFVKDLNPLLFQPKTNASTTTTTEAAEFEPDEPKKGKAEKELETRDSQATHLDKYNHRNFYTNCQIDKQCLGNSKNCASLRSCEVAVSYEPKSGGIFIELLGRTGKYVALGFSADQKMGDDAVIDCVREHDEVQIHRSFNQEQGRNNIRLPPDHSVVSGMKGHFHDDWLYCSFLLPSSMMRIKTSPNRTLTFNLAKDSFYLLLARGNGVGWEKKIGIAYHDLGTTVTQKKINLMALGETSLRRLFQRLHGIAILIAWILILPISTFVMRYFKNTCYNRFIGSLSLWFAVHVILNGIVVGLTVAAVIIILIPSRGRQIGSSGWTQHNISTIIFTFLILLQVFLGIRIYAQRHSGNNVVSCFHAILGHVTFLFSFYIIWASRHIRHGLPCATFSVLIAWLVVYFLIHLVISYQVCYVDFIHGADSSRIYKFTGLAPSPVTDAELEPSGGIVRKVLLWILIVVSVVGTGIMLGMYAFGLPDCIIEAENDIK